MFGGDSVQSIIASVRLRFARSCLSYFSRCDMKDITVDQFDDVVANITICRYLGFNQAELPPEGKGHNKALNISWSCVWTPYYLEFLLILIPHLI